MFKNVSIERKRITITRKRSLTLRDVSEASGRVSRVPRGRGDVSQTTRDWVHKAANYLGYVPNRIAVVGITDYIPEKEETVLYQMLPWRPAGIIITNLEHSDTSRIITSSTTPK